MFKRALKFVSAAAVLLAPTLSMVAAAPPAHASGTDNFYHWRMGQASVHISHDESNDPSCARTFDSYYAANIGSVAPDPVATFGKETVNYHYAPGTSVTVQFAWNQITPSGGLCTNSLATSADVELVDQALNVKQAWTGITLGGVNHASQTFTFPSAAGDYALEIFLNGGNENGAGTYGGCCGPLHDPTNDVLQSYYTLGVLSSGYMASLYDKRGTGTCTGTTLGCFETDESLLGKSMSVTRVYNGNHGTGGGTWGAPDAQVATDASHNVGVVYSERWAPGASGFVAESSSTHLFQSVADGWDDTTGVHGVTNGLSSQIQSLEQTAVANKVPITFTLFHEPHEYPSSGFGVDVTSSEYTVPTGQAHAPCTAGASSTCFGTAAEYRAMYHHLEQLAQQYGKDTVGQQWVRVMYIETDFNMTDQTAGKYLCPQVQQVGCNDPTRPASTDYDVLGPDLYNFYYFNGVTTWKEATDVRKLNISGTAGLVTLAHNEQKHILVAEMGTHPGCPGGWNSQNTHGGPDDAKCPSGISSGESKNGWFQTLANGLAGTSSTADMQQWVLGFVYFHVALSTGHDYEFVNRENPTLNLETACPNTFGTSSCWNGDIDSSGDHDTNGWGKAFVTGGTNDNWFVGGTTGNLAWGRQPLYFG